MAEDRSRTYRSLQNSVVGLGIYLATLLLSFVSRKVYIDNLGTEVLGLNTTAQNLLGFLNIAELGIGSAIACTLYKPLYEKDERAINEIVSLQGWLYRRIAMIVGGGALVLMAFFPLIFEKIEIPLYYAYLSFGAFLVSSLLSYFINYQSIVLSANQKDYLIKGSYGVTSLLKVACQIVAVRFSNQPFLWWCALEVMFAFLASFVMHMAVRKDAPFLKTSISSGRDLRVKYPDVITKVKQLFFHQISYYVLSQSGTFILYAFSSLTSVALIGNYSAIIGSLQNFINAGTGNVGASVGNLISQGDRERTLRVFEELFSIRFLIAGIVCICMYVLSSSFISLWLGSEYILEDKTVILLVLGSFVTLTRSTVGDYVNAKGLFQDVWAPITEAISHLLLSILLGYFYGLNGVLLGGLITHVLMICVWKPYFLFKYGLEEPIITYVSIYLKHLCALFLAFYLGNWILGFVGIDPSKDFLLWIIAGLLYSLIWGLTLYGILYCVSRGMRDFSKRVVNMVQRRI